MIFLVDLAEIIEISYEAINIIISPKKISELYFRNILTLSPPVPFMSIVQEKIPHNIHKRGMGRHFERLGRNLGALEVNTKTLSMSQLPSIQLQL